MAITTTVTDNFASPYADGVSIGDLVTLGNEFVQSSTREIKVALFTSTATLGATTTTYSSTNEVSGQGYTAGGLQFSSDPTVTINGGSNSDIHIVDFPDAVWTNATFTARGALIYQLFPTTGNPSESVAVFDFGGNFVVTNGTFTIVWPPATLQRAAIRIIG